MSNSRCTFAHAALNCLASASLCNSNQRFFELESHNHLMITVTHMAAFVQGHEVVYNPQTPNLGGGATPANGKGVVGGVPLSAHAGSPTGHSPTAVGYTGGLAPVGQKIRRKSGAFTSGAVTHPASLAAAGKPTGLEEMVSSPSFSRSNTPNQTPTANQRHH